MKQKTTLSRNFFLIATLLVATCHLSAQTLVAHYKFDGNTTDETGNWNLTESSGFTATFETGQDGTANGAVSGFGLNSSNYLSTVADFTPQSGTNGNVSRTLMAWIKLGSNGNQAIVGYGAGVNAGGIEYNKFTYGCINNNGAVGPRNRIEVQGAGQSGAELALNTWVHTAVVYDAANAKFLLYVNGVFDAESATSLSLPLGTDSNPLFIGNDYSGADPFNPTTPIPPSRGFSGAIDDVRIFSEVLTEAQIKAIYDDTVLGTEESKLVKAFNAYPNPVKDRLYFSTNKIASVEVYNLLGSKISSQTVIDGVDMSNLTKGVYLVKCIDAQGVSLATIKAIKE